MHCTFHPLEDSECVGSVEINMYMYVSMYRWHFIDPGVHVLLFYFCLLTCFVLYWLSGDMYSIPYMYAAHEDLKNVLNIIEDTL